MAEDVKVEDLEPTVDEAAVEEEDGVVSEEMLDTIADTAIAVLQDILKYFNVGDVTIDEYEGDEGELILDITGGDLAVLIGRHGKTLDALQFLVSAITVRTIGFRYPVVVDVEGYKNRQREKLESIARSSANRAASSGNKVKASPYDALRAQDRSHCPSRRCARHDGFRRGRQRTSRCRCSAVVPLVLFLKARPWTSLFSFS